MYQFVVVGGSIAYLPIELGYAIVYPSFISPHQHIGIEVIVVLQTVGARAVGVALLVAIDAEGRHAKLHPRLGLMNSLSQLLDKLVHIVPAPVAKAQRTVLTGFVPSIIGNRHPWGGIRIEVVVNMQSVNIIALHDVFHHLANVVAVLLQGGVQQRQSVVLEAPFGVLLRHVVISISMGCLRLGTIGIDPGV